MPLKPELEDLLCEHLGELMQQKENEFDWIAKDELVIKIRAVNILLESKVPNEQTFLEKVENIITNAKQSR